MSDETRDLAAYRLERAREALLEAALLFDAGHLNVYVNRLYYACFYCRPHRGPDDYPMIANSR